MAARLERLISIKRIFNLSAIMKEVYIFPLDDSIVLRAPILSIVLCPLKSGSQTNCLLSALSQLKPCFQSALVWIQDYLILNRNLFGDKPRVFQNENQCSKLARHCVLHKWPIHTELSLGWTPRTCVKLTLAKELGKSHWHGRLLLPEKARPIMMRLVYFTPENR